MAENSYGGYDYKFVDKNLERFICNTICTKVLRDPHLTGCCGQHFCESCLNNWFTKQGKKSCPYCRAEGKRFQHLLNKSLKRDVDSLRIHCPNKKEGCQWVGEIRSLKDHLESDCCSLAEVECPNKCRRFIVTKSKKVAGSRKQAAVTKLKRKEVEDHIKKHCYLRPYQCEYCGHKDTYTGITGQLDGSYVQPTKSHYQSCPDFPLECHNKCGAKDIKRKDMKHHRNDCIDELIDCPNKCGVKGIKRKNVQNHRSKCQEELVECPNLCMVEYGPSLEFGNDDVYIYPCVFRRKFMERHLNNECCMRMYECENCLKEVTFADIVDHYFLDCPEFPLDCPNECGVKYIKRKDMEDHYAICPEEVVECPFGEAGCNADLVRRELEQHMSTTQQQHLLMVMGAYTKMKKANDEMKRELESVKYELEQVKFRGPAPPVPNYPPGLMIPLS